MTRGEPMTGPDRRISRRTGRTGQADCIGRRGFLSACGCSAALAALRPAAAAIAADCDLLAGQGTVDVTPPLGITMGGFHFPPGNRRVIEGVRQRSFARVLMVQAGGEQLALVSLPTLNASRAFVERVQQSIAEAVDIPPLSVRVCASHSHSMPTIAFNRQWGDQHPDYFDTLVAGLTKASCDARDDMSAAALYVGAAVAEQANANRTTETWKTEDLFDSQATAEDRWLDRRVNALHFERPGAQTNLLWYHFSAHPTCFTDRQCGPDWPGAVEADYSDLDRIAPAFLQGHIGDVSPGGGGLGNAAQTSFHICRALPRAVLAARRVRADTLRVASRQINLPVDIELLKQQMEAYRSACPADPADGWYAGYPGCFERDWYENFAIHYDQSRDQLPTTIAAIRIGDLAMVFHPAELYSYYGLAIERAVASRHVIVVGYAEDYVGYVPDPRAFRDQEYAAITVPKILNYPPFATTVGDRLVEQAAALVADL